jgi:hypothetical protein
MSYGGLRGAIAFALVLLIDPKHVPLAPLFVTTTICVIYFTVFLQGITIKPLVNILKVKRAEKRKPTMNERIHERFIDHMMAGMEDVCGKTGNYTIRDKFKRFDNRFIRPYLIRDLKVSVDSSYYRNAYRLFSRPLLSFAGSGTKDHRNVLEAGYERCNRLYAPQSIGHRANDWNGINECIIQKLYYRRARWKVSCLLACLFVCFGNF